LPRTTSNVTATIFKLRAHSRRNRKTSHSILLSSPCSVEGDARRLRWVEAPGVDQIINLPDSYFL
jgi:hypothetical protein